MQMFYIKQKEFALTVRAKVTAEEENVLDENLQIKKGGCSDR